MKRVSVTDLRTICDTRRFLAYRLVSADQPRNDIDYSIQFDLTFQQILIAENPDIICLKGTGGMLYFRHIKYVCAAPVDTILGFVFDVICTDSMYNGGIAKYRILAIE